MPQMQKIYTTRPGDTLSMIAQASGMTLADLLALNPQIANPNLIVPGQQIVIPHSVDRSTVLRKLAASAIPGPDPDWFKIAVREENSGVEEYNRGSNPRIVEYLASCRGLSPKQSRDDGTAWCSAFVNWCLRVGGMPGTNSARALSWTTWGKSANSPGTGSVVVWQRLKETNGQSALIGGHVAFLVEDLGQRLLVLGGNQGDRVCRSSYPRDGYVSDRVSGGVRVRNRYKLVAFRKPPAH